MPGASQESGRGLVGRRAASWPLLASDPASALADTQGRPKSRKKELEPQPSLAGRARQAAACPMPHAICRAARWALSWPPAGLCHGRAAPHAARQPGAPAPSTPHPNTQRVLCGREEKQGKKAVQGQDVSACTPGTPCIHEGGRAQHVVEALQDPVRHQGEVHGRMCPS